MSRTYRAAYWTDGQGGEVALTGPEHAHLDPDALVAEARAEAERAGLDLSYGRIEIGPWCDPRVPAPEPPATKAVAMEMRKWLGDVWWFQCRVEDRRAALRTHGPEPVLAPLREALERLEAALSLAADDLWERVQELEAQK